MLVVSCSIIIRDSKREWRCARLRQYPHITATNGTAPRPKAEFRTTGLWTNGRTKKKEWKKEKAPAFAEPTARQVGHRGSDQDLVGSLVQLLRFYVKLLQEIGEALTAKMLANARLIRGAKTEP